MKNQKAYLIGGGIASLASAVYLIKDGNFNPENIYIFEEGMHFGGSLDDNDISDNKFLCRGERMFTKEVYNCTLDFLSKIPQENDKTKTLLDDFQAFNNNPKNHWFSKARLIEKNKIIDASKFGLSTGDEINIIKVLTTPEEKIEGVKIKDFFSPEFFETNFWYMVCTTFAFQPWHSLIELRRYAYRFIHLLPYLPTMTCITNTRYNQYESMVEPTVKWLTSQNVNFVNNTLVTDFIFENISKELEQVKKIEYIQNDHHKQITVNENDLVFFTNGSMVTNFSLGTMTEAPKIIVKNPVDAWTIWNKIAQDRPHFGRPEIFNHHLPESKWESFSITFNNSIFTDLLKNFTKSEIGTGGLITIKDSNWLITLFAPSQPHFKNQPTNVNIVWGYGLKSDQKGNFVNKKMSECNGTEILTEVSNHLGFNQELNNILSSANCTPCMMPYITSQFIGRKISDRPRVIPEKTKNFAFIGQYCEIPEEIVFTVEQSIRSAMIAVYGLLNIKKDIPAIYHGQHDPKAISALFGLCLDQGFKQLCEAVIEHRKKHFKDN